MDFYLKVKGKMDTQYRDTQDVYLRVRGEVGKCKVTQEIYQQVRGEVGTQCTDTQNLYLKVKGEVGESV